MKGTKQLGSSMGNYLEAIAGLKKINGVVRIRDISHLLGVKPPSVASALNSLSKSGLVIHRRYGYVELTSEGEKLANDIEHKYRTLFEFLTEILDIDSRVAAKDASKMKHSISPRTLEKITKFMEFVKTC
jgi:DtxR family Mn-dependent transcriptional regulator